MFDIGGVLSLIVLIALFGFLTTRAWRLRNAILRWVGVVIAALLTLIPTALLVLALIGFYKLNERHDNPVADVHIASTAAQVARGEQLAHLCVRCHTANDQLPLSGVNFLAKFPAPPLGTLYAPNLTPSGNIKDWTDGELIRAIREGVNKSGRSLIIMPARKELSDNDVQALVAYLRSQPSTSGPTPTTQINFFGALFINLFDWLTVQPSVGRVTAPQPGTSEYGRYMVDVIGCRGCHGDQLQGKPNTGAPGPPPGPNLTAIVPQWTEEQFMTFFNTGIRPDGTPVPTIMLPSGYTDTLMPWQMVRASATDPELRAMYAYLHSLPLLQTPSK
jgi:cytochrome c553